MLSTTRTGALRIARRLAVSHRHYSSDTKAVSESATTVGFIGLGQMGYRMASNLLAKRQYRLLIHDAAPSTLTRFRDEAADAATRIAMPGSARAVAAEADVVITMLPESHHVQTAYLDDAEGILAGIRPGTLCIDSSTIAPKVAQEVAKATAQAGGAAIDAPVSGGVVGAQAGTLTFMVGGAEADFQQAKPYLSAMGHNLVHCGASGMGQVAKVCNNMLLGIMMLGTAEAMRLGVELGMDASTLAGVFNTSTGRSWSSEVNNPCPGVLPNAPSSRQYEGGFAAALMAKDMRLAVEAAAQANTTVILGSTAQQIYVQVSRTPGLERKDFSVVYQWTKPTENHSSKQ